MPKRLAVPCAFVGLGILSGSFFILISAQPYSTAEGVGVFGLVLGILLLGIGVSTWGAALAGLILGLVLLGTSLLLGNVTRGSTSIPDAGAFIGSLVFMAALSAWPLVARNRFWRVVRGGVAVGMWSLLAALFIGGDYGDSYKSSEIALLVIAGGGFGTALMTMVGRALRPLYHTRPRMTVAAIISVVAIAGLAAVPRLQNTEQPTPSIRLSCSRGDAERVLLREARLRAYAPLANISRFTRWNEEGPCSWMVVGELVWRNELSNEPVTMDFNAMVHRERDGVYEVAAFRAW